jgi:16S rRNA (cytosine1407-C5)-methyltransferase
MSDLPPLPELFSARLAAILPPAALAAARDSFAADKPTAFRLNPLVGPTAEIPARLQAQGFALTPAPWLTDVYLTPPQQRRALTESAEFAAGRLYIQNLAALSAALLLDPQPGESVLDLAAAPGGKTLQLAAAMGRAGRLVAVEPISSRFYKLKANLQQHGAPWVETYRMDGRAAGRRWPERFDRVLLDAPCSSEARFSRLDPGSWAHWSLRKIKEAAHKQRGLLWAGLYALRPGGTLVYSTCSLAPEENEAVVQAVLRRVGGAVTIRPIPLAWPNLSPGLTHWQAEAYDPALQRAGRILPDGLQDAFFICCLHKEASLAPPPSPGRRSAAR